MTADDRPLHVKPGSGAAALAWDLDNHPEVDAALQWPNLPPPPEVPEDEQAELAGMMASLYAEQKRRNAEGTEGGGSGHRSAADRLVALAVERYDLGRADDGEPFAVERDGPNVAHMFRGGRASLRAALANDYATEMSKVPPAQALVDALAVLEGRARAAARQTLPLRAALRDGAVLLDLADESGRVVRVDETGWTILPRSPIAFRRSELTGSLPTPESGNLGRLGELVNLAPGDLSCALAQCVAAMLGMPVPIILLRGPAGAAKTTGARLLATMIDPGPAPVRAAPRDVEAWAVAASGSLVVALDNLDSVPSWLSDALCRAVTGEAIVRRALYTDSGLSVLAFRRAVIVTSIDAGAVRGDLADRLLAVEMPAIAEDRRREDGEVAAAFADAHPAILGGLLDLAAAVLRLLPTIRLDRRPRMADFARVLAAVDAIRGTEGLARYLGQRAELQREAAEGDRVGSALLAWAPGHLPWSGTASELLDALTPDRPPKDWPATGRALSGSLRRLAQPLAAAGIVAAFEREAGSGSRRLIRLEEQTRATVATVATVAGKRQDATVGDRATLGDGRSHAESGNGPPELPWPPETPPGAYDPALPAESDALLGPAATPAAPLPTSSAVATIACRDYLAHASAELHVRDAGGAWTCLGCESGAPA